MRVLKFRAWYEKEKQYVHFTGIFNERPVVSQDSSWNGTAYTTTKRYGASIIEQFTGLHDKTGKEIYEGDRLAVINPNGEREHDWSVWYDDMACCFPYEPEGGFGEFDISALGWARDMGFILEVIGTVHDQKEEDHALSV